MLDISLSGGPLASVVYKIFLEGIRCLHAGQKSPPEAADCCPSSNPFISSLILNERS